MKITGSTVTKQEETVKNQEITKKSRKKEKKYTNEAQKAILKKKENNFCTLAGIGLLTALCLSIVGASTALIGEASADITKMIENSEQGKIEMALRLDDYLDQYKRGEISYSEYQEKVADFNGEDLVDKINSPGIEQAMKKENTITTVGSAIAAAALLPTAAFAVGGVGALACGNKFKKNYGYSDDYDYACMKRKQLNEIIEKGEIKEDDEVSQSL
ncbi:MAG: hypothetical protein J6A28_02820 [Clostridia bacterium]|nr:hypothetical protein [Clostridia bacterium]